VYFLGGFGRPGALQLMRNDLSLLQALALVAGCAGADGDNGFVLGRTKRIPVNFTKLLQKGDLTQTSSSTGGLRGAPTQISSTQARSGA